MKCEACILREVEVEVFPNEDLGGSIWDTYPVYNPYRVCADCYNRLINFALRPLELFNIVATHGHSHYLHDDFYDYQTGEATQPHIEVIDADKFTFPDFERIKNDLNRLIDFSFVQHFTEDYVISQLKQFDKHEVLASLQERVRYNRVINYKAYIVAGRVVGRAAEEWIKEEWANRQENELHLFAEPIAKCIEFDKAFEIISRELENGDDRFLSENVSALLYFQSDKTLDWIEGVSSRIKNVSSAWGQLAASSQFSWDRANKWLAIGRPLSLVALDALIFCTTTGERLNQSLWLRNLQPKLVDNPKPETVAKRLQDYLQNDRVPRTKAAVENIINNMFEIEL
ncbi:hypothetical protein [uncultured Pontibacter sp.]|uniref:hypothetical protein n=1 Tax=uncultured Pontibacter sp. TaxID=453356 RepID=UPI0026172B24|nr:hypothetical protein [uncultured Pontibacter sp.]